MRNGFQEKLPVGEVAAMKADLLREAKVEGAGLAFEERPDGDATVTLVWRVVPLDVGDARPAAQDPGAEWDGSVPDAAMAVVKRVEGFSATPYDDNGALPGGTWTIGYGSILDANRKPVTPDTAPIAEAEAVTLLRRDMAEAARAVKARVRVPLKTHEAAALISWTYNLGAGALGGSTMLRKLNAGDRSAVPSEMRKWIMQEGKPLTGLLRRRWAEAAIFLGKDPTGACVRAWREIDSIDDWPSF